MHAIISHMADAIFVNVQKMFPLIKNIKVTRGQLFKGIYHQIIVFLVVYVHSVVSYMYIAMNNYMLWFQC